MRVVKADGREPDSLAEDGRLLAILRSQPRDSPQREAACASLVARYQWLVNACVRHYSGSPESVEDLTQVGYVGLLKAINNFDPGLGADLSAYARPTISGEIKRHFRDKRWQVHVTRPVKELRLDMRSATAELSQHLQRTPTDPEIARFLQVSDESLAKARRADMSFQPLSLNAPVARGRREGLSELADLVGGADARLDQVIDMEALATCWPQLPHTQQRAVLMRFYGDMTQADIGAELGVSQMQVSRLQTRALNYLRAAIDGRAGAGPGKPDATASAVG
jgi:RNA polymerase sigma-B factor